jgi:hydroxymethylpyrimidine pyrophosphatase-like HAD family hydrolase
LAKKKTIIFDFDGVIANYDKWEGVNVFGTPNLNTIKAIQQLKKAGNKIIIYTTRLDTPELREYLKNNNIPYDEINENSDNPKDTSNKPIGDIYIDDRAINFHNQSTNELLKEIQNFKKV